MLKQSRRDGVSIGAHGISGDFHQRTVRIPFGVRVSAAKIFKPVNDSEGPQATHVPQVEFVHHLRENPREAVAGKEFLVGTTQQDAHFVHLSCRQGAILPTGVQNHLLEIAVRVRVPDLCEGSNDGLPVDDALDDSGVQSWPRIADLVVGKVFLHKRRKSEADNFHSALFAHFNNSTSRCMRRREELLPSPQSTGMPNDLRSVLGWMQLQAFAKVARLRLSPREHGVHQRPQKYPKRPLQGTNSLIKVPKIAFARFVRDMRGLIELIQEEQ